MMAIDVGGSGFEGVTYPPESRELFVAAPMAPPEGDELLWSSASQAATSRWA